MIDYAMDYSSPETAMKVRPKITWQKPGASVDLLRVHDEMFITLKDGRIVSEPFIKEISSWKEPAFRWVCNVEYTGIHTHENGEHVPGRLFLTCDVFNLISYRLVLQRLLIMNALNAK